MSWIQIVHQLPGRTRLLASALRRDEARCTQVADALAAVQGVREVRVRPYTGSALVRHDRDIDANAIVEPAARVLGAEVIPPGAPLPVPRHVPPFSAVARELAQAMRDLDQDVLRKSDGAVDLGTLVTLVMFGAGAAEVVRTSKLPVPPWFNLAWWGFQTFMATEQEEIAAGGDGSTSRP